MLLRKTQNLLLEPTNDREILGLNDREERDPTIMIITLYLTMRFFIFYFSLQQWDMYIYGSIAHLILEFMGGDNLITDFISEDIFELLFTWKLSSNC